MVSTGEDRTGRLNKVATIETISGMLAETQYRGDSNVSSKAKLQGQRRSTLEGFADAVSALRPYIE